MREKGKKKKNLRLSVKQHSALMFHGIPGRVNSNSCKNSQPAFTFAGFFFFSSSSSVCTSRSMNQAVIFAECLSVWKSCRMQHRLFAGWWRGVKEVNF